MNLKDRLKKVACKLSPPESPVIHIIIYNRYKNETKEQAVKRYENENGITISSNDNPIFIAVSSKEQIRADREKQ